MSKVIYDIKMSEEDKIILKGRQIEQYYPRIVLYVIGLSDREIGSVLGIDGGSVGRWRKRLGLKINMQGGVVVHQKRKAGVRRILYDIGLTDDEIQDTTKINLEIIKKWRKENNLPPNEKNYRILDI